MGEMWAEGELLLGGEASGELVVLTDPLSFWGGVDEETGRIIDAHHPQVGTLLAGAVVLMGPTKGSSSSTSTLLECSRRRTAPAALLLTAADPILLVASAVAWELYGEGPTVMLIDDVPVGADRVGRLHIDRDGRATLAPSAPAGAAE